MALRVFSQHCLPHGFLVESYLSMYPNGYKQLWGHKQIHLLQGGNELAIARLDAKLEVLQAQQLESRSREADFCAELVSLRMNQLHEVRKQIEMTLATMREASVLLRRVGAPNSTIFCKGAKTCWCGLVHCFLVAGVMMERRM